MPSAPGAKQQPGCPGTSARAAPRALRRCATPSALARYLGQWKEHIATWDATVSEQILFAVGCGASLAAVTTGALIIKQPRPRSRR